MGPWGPANLTRRGEVRTHENGSRCTTKKETEKDEVCCTLVPLRSKRRHSLEEFFGPLITNKPDKQECRYSVGKSSERQFNALNTEITGHIDKEYS